MRIVIQDYAGHPFTLELSREFARRGHDVLHLYTTAGGGPKAGFPTKPEGSLDVRNINIGTVNKRGLLSRRRQEAAYGRAALETIRSWRPDVLVSANTPLVAQRQLLEWSKGNSVPFVFWLQDVISIAMRSLLRKRIGPLAIPVAAWYGALEAKMLRDSDAVVCICDDFKAILRQWGVMDDSISTIPNWASIDEIPVLPRRNDFSGGHGLDGKFVVLYSGTLGMKHDPSVIIRLAQAFEEDREMLFVVASEGSGTDFLRAEQERLRLGNLRLLPLQPFSSFPAMLASADLHLVMLEREAGVFSVPSKLWSSYCSGRPSMVLVPEENAAARITRESEAGVVVSCDRFDEALEAMKKLRDDHAERKRLGTNARRYAEENFRISEKADRFEEIFSSCLGGAQQ